MPEPRAALQSNVYLRKLLRQQWRSEHVANGSPTASIERALAPTAAGSPQVGSAPTVPNVSSTLDNLNVAVSYPGNYEAQVPQIGGVPLRQNERIFSFLDIPATTGVAAGTIQATDFIVFEGRRWKPTEIENDRAIGTSHCRAELWGR